MPKVFKPLISVLLFFVLICPVAEAAYISKLGVSDAVGTGESTGTNHKIYHSLDTPAGTGESITYRNTAGFFYRTVTIESTTPANGSTDQAKNTSVTINFSTSMETTSAEAALSINPAKTGSFSWGSSGKALTFTPATDLADNTTYTVTVGASAADAFGDVMGWNYTFSFTTGTGGDTTSPEAVSDLRRISSALNSIGLSWTAPHDDATDAGSGSVSLYNLRYSTSNITSANFNAASQIITATPKSPGATETVTLEGLTHNTTYYFALKSRDEVGSNWSTTSNVTLGATANDTIAPSVEVTFPNGGERIKGGSIYTISWEAADAGGSTIAANGVSIYYSTGEGNVEIISGLSNSGSYNWTVPGSFSSKQAVVKVSAADQIGNLASDESNAAFTIDSSAPAVSISSPGGGQYLKGGNTTSIAWTAADSISGLTATPITLYYSSNEGTTYTQIATSTIANGSYPWTTPAFNSATVRIKVAALDNVGWIGSSETTNLTIDSTQPVITVNSPSAAGISWEGGTQKTITWTATDELSGIDYIEIYYSRDGTTYISQATREANDGSYTWNVPLVSTAEAKVRLRATDRAGNIGSDESDSAFTIYTDNPDTTAPAVTLEALTGGQTLIGGRVYSISWRATDNSGGSGLSPSPISLYYSTNAGTTYTTVESGYANSGTYVWTVPDISSSQLRIKITAADLVGNLGSDESSSNLTVTRDTTAPSVEVVTPNGGESWAGGSTHNIIWSATDEASGLAANPISIYYSTNEGSSYPYQIAVNLTNSGSYEWTLPNLDSRLTKVKVTAADNNGNLGTDESSAAFMIDSTPPSVAVLSPNGGENLTAGATRTITWVATDEGSGVSSIALSYSKDGGATFISISGATALAGAAASYSWIVPNINKDSVKIKITATDRVGNTSSDQSDANFSVASANADETRPAVTVTAPNGGESLTGGTVYTISWTATDEGGLTDAPITLYYSTNEGASYPNTIVSGIANLGTYNWTLPNINNTQMKIKAVAVDASGNVGSDESNAKFTVSYVDPTTSQPTVTAVSPASGAVNVSLNKSIQITFSKSMNARSVAEAFQISPSVNGSSAWIGNLLVYSPSSSLLASTRYTVTIESSAKDEYDNALAGGKYSFSFTTTAEVADTSTPTVLGVVPVNGATGLPNLPTIGVAFSKSMNKNSVQNNFSITGGVGGNFTWNGQMLTFTPNAPLTSGTTYIVTIGRNAAAAAGVSLEADYLFSFTVKSEDSADADSPQILAAYPSGGSIPINVPDSIRISFSEKMDLSSVRDSLTITHAGGIVGGTVAWDGNTAIVTPAANLETNTLYTVNIGTASRDVSGNALARAYSWTFTTSSSSDLSGPNIVIRIGETQIFSNDTIPAQAEITATVTDESSLDTNSLKLSVDGVRVNPDIKQVTASHYTLKYTPATPLLSSATHTLKAEAIDTIGNASTLEVSGLEIKSGSAQLIGRTLNYPNPFRPAAGQGTYISYTLNVDSNISIFLYDQTARLIWLKTYLSGTPGGQAGYNEVYWSGQTDFSEIAGNGMYLYRIVANGKVIGTGKLVVLD